jgi:hypothetical protein
MEQFGSHRTNFDEILYLWLFRKSDDKIQVSLKSIKTNGYFTWRRFNIYDNISLNSSHDEKCFEQSCRENQNIHFMFSNFLPEIRDIFEIMTKNVVEPERPQTMGCLRVVCWMSKATRTHTHALASGRKHTHTHNSGNINAPQCYFIHAFPVLFR